MKTFIFLTALWTSSFSFAYSVNLPLERRGYGGSGGYCRTDPVAQIIKTLSSAIVPFCKEFMGLEPSTVYVTNTIAPWLAYPSLSRDLTS